MKLILIIFLFTSFSSRASDPSADSLKNLVKYVNTLQGTNSKHELTRGNTFPTTALPFAMNTWTPQTGKMVMDGNINISKIPYEVVNRHTNVVPGLMIIN